MLSLTSLSVSTSAPRLASALLAATLLFAPLVSRAAITDAQWQELQDQNRLLREQQKLQQSQIEELRARLDRATGVAASASSSSATSSASLPPRDSTGEEPSADSRAIPEGAGDASARKLVISGEVGIVFFAGSTNTQYPHDEFRIDDANLRFEASLWRDTYFFGELQVTKRESLDEWFHMGEFYVEFENLSGALGGPERLVNVRFGRVDIPFGEEYQHRDPLANPLVTHSLSDIWGTDEGLELYGEFGKASYAIAVQNGSVKTMRDYHSSKSLTVRISYDVTPRLHLSASAMRTGKLLSGSEPLSEVWIGNNVFRNIGGSTVHEGEIAEFDASYTWNTGHVRGAIGRARYDDNAVVENERDFSYFQVEAMQSINRQFYAAARFSTLRASEGYPLTGIGSLGTYFLGSLLTTDLQRISIGGGYRFNPALGLKFDYTLEDGELTTGASRDNRLFAAEAVIGF